ncbi:universal stress protein [Nocardia sp. NPDC051787]|uniref:universal stress protein n=1 Tax=Nocardia sp. NPDC051787 TaxID=3155415 RepID=UPI00343353E6
MRTIVVGVDGSPPSQEALRWALAEARCHGSTVRAVHAWSLPYHQGEIGHMAVERLGEPLHQEAERTLETALRAAMSGGDGVPIERLVVESPSARALIDAAADADLLVVGSRGRGGFTGLMLGSTSQQCAQHGPCPVVIVHAAPTAVDPP